MPEKKIFLRDHQGEEVIKKKKKFLDVGSNRFKKKGLSNVLKSTWHVLGQKRGEKTSGVRGGKNKST